MAQLPWAKELLWHYLQLVSQWPVQLEQVMDLWLQEVMFKEIWTDLLLEQEIVQEPLWNYIEVGHQLL
jgi:hypothetical protein